MAITTFSRGPMFAAQPLPPRRPRLRIGLLNNMPDAAMAATEHQFSSLLQVATEGTPVTLQLFALGGVARGEAAQAQMLGRYQPAEALAGAELDGLIVTGAEPRAAELDQETYWPNLARVIDWTHDTGMPTIWSCLAAHAAVQRLSHIRRRPLPTKLSGVFKSLAAREDPLLDGAAAQFVTPHSRLNTLAEEDLVEKGYRVLTRSGSAGVDSFIKRGVGLQLYFQGHPEYEADSLKKEYARDVARFLSGRRASLPDTPVNYFDHEVEAALAELSDYASRRPDPKLVPYYTAILAKAAPTRAWRGSAVQLYRNWLKHVTEAKRPMLSSSRAVHSFA